jgi:hypothetical protein
VRNHDANKSAALIAKATGTKVAGDNRRKPRELTKTRKIENAAVAATMAGRVVTSRLARYNASRVALPAMNCALTAPEHTIAVVRAESERGGGEAIYLWFMRGPGSVDGPESQGIPRCRSSYHPASDEPPCRGARLNRPCYAAFIPDRVTRIRVAASGSDPTARGPMPIT